MEAAKHNDMKECAEICWNCRHTCQKTLFNHCLEMGGEHVGPDHIKLMTDCIELCQTAADMMVRVSKHHAAVCLACAEICEACAASCEKIGGDEMQECAEACRACADSCRAMGNGHVDLGRHPGLHAGEEASGIMA